MIRIATAINTRLSSYSINIQSKYSGYANLTAKNFIIALTETGNCLGWQDHNGFHGDCLSLVKTYIPSTGIFTLGRLNSGYSTNDSDVWPIVDILLNP